ncbi:hypothetical protein HKBW3S42_00500 [Candidatus Hakubella thermalkaliphila]|uniref:Uncharacterized protein n=1 Tax=Candidatus Hakubella thermalkaliphila TaxID=2754717 RepID=A0A6V8PHP3_9ACTN|nr:hypothetical protein [Candidatus Hakubella thermalkaliphila]GFP27919.1 hypothetical protein HKBW3S33_01330 [Candidatus Hakubella thermalkaliphila]GFP32195.1 hypothetical protein HKBW3S42_00500 [Candidatus Hakubella thermalkaliphila]
MGELVLRYDREISIKPLVDKAIRREIGLLEVACNALLLSHLFPMDLQNLICYPAKEHFHIN